jgi:hypothetical protein
MIIPDGLIFLNPSYIRSLSEGTDSPYATLSHNPDLFASPKKRLLRVEATPRFNIGDKPQFEFISSCWEDKKSNDDQLESAYRQNRMVCAAVCRQLRAFSIRLPVFGIIWTQGKAMTHVDWCVEGKKGRQVSPVSVQGQPFMATDDVDASRLSIQRHTQVPRDQTCQKIPTTRKRKYQRAYQMLASHAKSPASNSISGISRSPMRSCKFTAFFATSICGHQVFSATR